MAKEKNTRKPRQSTTPADETKAQKFSRLASKRVTKALKAVKNIGNLAGAGYERTPDQVQKIANLLNETVKATMARFSATSAAKVEEEIKI